MIEASTLVLVVVAASTAALVLSYVPWRHVVRWLVWRLQRPTFDARPGGDYLSRRYLWLLERPERTTR